MRLVRYLSALAPNYIPSLFLLYFLDFLLSRLVHMDYILLQLLQLLLELRKTIVEAFLVLLVLVELVIEKHDLLLVANLLALVERLFEVDSVPLVFKLTILLVIDD